MGGAGVISKNLEPELVRQVTSSASLVLDRKGYGESTLMASNNQDSGDGTGMKGKGCCGKEGKLMSTVIPSNLSTAEEMVTRRETWETGGWAYVWGPVLGVPGSSVTMREVVRPFPTPYP
jgi:hypothetical protein